MQAAYSRPTKPCFNNAKKKMSFFSLLINIAVFHIHLTKIDSYKAKLSLRVLKYTVVHSYIAFSGVNEKQNFSF